uniref:Uncharacterized protein n=1 Tax=Meloidogyne javanica TaxID=6303 RepID=A0A915N8C7_MELJA
MPINFKTCDECTNRICAYPCKSSESACENCHKIDVPKQCESCPSYNSTCSDCAKRVCGHPCSINDDQACNNCIELDLPKLCGDCFPVGFENFLLCMVRVYYYFN